MKIILSLLLLVFTAPVFAASGDGNCRQVTDKELKDVLATRANVEKERIEKAPLFVRASSIYYF